MAGPELDLNPLPPANSTEPPGVQQRQVIQWERFLPRRSLRVLLVEQDDSTRHIVAALLRKCSYGVSAVADGLKAWEVLKDKQYRFDLVLTEVEMPSLSGIGLLSKIMSCELSKDIPIIMMSSQDSVSVVYKCMLKGAVDFLVKPIRRNELRNLWQHVWRKHCSASYENGDESINNNAIKSDDMSNNNAASNHGGLDAGFAPKEKERSNDGDDTKSSGSKLELQIQSVERHEKPTVSNCSTPTALNLMVEKQHDDMMVEENVVKDHYSKSEENEIVETTVGTISKGKNQKPESFCATISCNKSHLDHGKDGVGEPSSPAQTSFLIKPSKQMINFIGAVANGECSYEVSKKDDKRPEATEYFHVTNVSTTDALPSWELSLRGPDVNGFSKKDSEERRVLKHSAASAFSRYSTGVRFTSQKCDSPVTLSVKMKTKVDGDNAAKEDNGSSTPTWMVTSSQGNEAVEPLCNRASSSSNNGANHSKENPTMTHCSLEHTKRNSNQNVTLPSGQLGFVLHPFPVRGLPFQSLYPGYDGMMPPVFYTDSFGHGSGDIDKGRISSRSGELRHNGNHVITRLTMRQQIYEGSQSCPADGRKGRMEKEHGNTRSLMCSDTAQSSKKCNCSQNHLNGAQCNGSCRVMDAAGSMGTIPEFGNQNGLQDQERKALSRDCSRREAALLKFRLKRKDRCFEKKVRYHNRQKLAEQRPRIKGQFVRQSVTESNTATIEEDD